ncbi:MAG: hypothetical protein OXN23_01195 [Gammaproteobacteria bacterium]|nr:hypothetical protein [Gammaproteobacteria bacterium]
MNSLAKHKGLLPPSALRGIRLGLSVSDSADLARLGLLEIHFRIALGEIARCVLLSGGEIVYGGHLDPRGYTAFLMHELKRYGEEQNPSLHICLAWQEHRKLSISEFQKQNKSLGMLGTITCLDVDGAPIDPTKGRSERPIPETDSEVRAKSLTALRRYMAEHVDAQIFIGGKREGYHGDMPGLIEEAIITLKTSRSIYLAGGFGGVTLDIIRALEIDSGSWFPQGTSKQTSCQRVIKGIGKLEKIKKSSKGVDLRNGLSDVENRKLATTHRPSEIAALICLGLSRKFAKHVH